MVYQSAKLQAAELKAGYDWAYRAFYSWSNIYKASLQHDQVKHMVKHFAYAGGWKKFETLWNFIIKNRQRNQMLPLLESILFKVRIKEGNTSPLPTVTEAAKIVS